MPLNSPDSISLVVPEEQYKTIVETAPAMLWIAGPDGSYQFFNPAWLAFTGRSLEQETGVGWLTLIHPDDVQKRLDTYASNFQNESQFQTEYRLKRKDGSYRWILENATPTYNHEGIFSGFMGSCVDVHELKEMDQKKNVFMAAASHDLKTPLTTIKIYVQLLEELLETKKEPEAISFVKQIGKQVNKFSSILKDFHELSKFQNDTLVYHKANWNFNALVAEAVADFQSITSTHSIDVIGQSSREVYCDKERIKEVINQLLNNAAKYSAGKEKLVVSLHENPEGVQLDITDFGLGIAPEFYDLIFRLFYRIPGKNNHTFPGLGTGLYKAAEIINKNGGKIWVQSDEGKHTTISFALPVI